MIQTEEFQPIAKLTHRIKVDMCAFGLKIPQTQKFLQKSSQIFTTDLQLHTKLSSFRCPKNHVHQHIEGSIKSETSGQRIPLTKFCASYCRGFAKKVSSFLTTQAAFVNDLDEDEPPAKRTRFSISPNKRFKTLHPQQDSIDLDAHSEIPSSSVPEVIPDIAPRDAANVPANAPSERWHDAFRLADQVAPRVGNLKVELTTELARMISQFFPQWNVQSIYVCRGTARCQIPVGLSDPHINTHRHTMCLERHSQKLHEFPWEEWSKLRRSERIRATPPCKLVVTCFGFPRLDAAPIVASSNPFPALDVPVPEAGRPDQISSQVAKTSNGDQVCEGWAPPPVALHGPKYRALNAQEKKDLFRVHQNLGHPDPMVLAEHLRAQRAAPHIVEAAREFVCDACVESVQRKSARPAKLHEPKDFNQQVGMDGFYWSGKRGFQVHIFHCIDEASLFHLGRRTLTRNPDDVIRTWTEFWTSWAGNPQSLYTDPAGEFISQEWHDMLQARSIDPQLSVEAWQRGRIERHPGEPIDRRTGGQ